MRERIDLWSDGSVVFQNYFWLTSAAYAVVNENEETIVAGRVLHVALNSYAAELFAILMAFLVSSCRIRIFSDCQTVVDQFHKLVQTGTLSESMSHLEWWQVILDVWKQRCIIVQEPLQLCWIRAHSFDHVPAALLTEEMAQSVGLTRRQVVCNQCADRCARRIALDNAPIDPKMFTRLHEQVFQHQVHLAKLNKEIGEMCPVRTPFMTKEECEGTQPDFFVARFPNWNWDPKLSEFPWVPTMCSYKPAKRCTLPEADFQTIVQFLGTLRWRVASDVGTGFVELLFLFLRRGYKFQCFAEENTCFNAALKPFKKALVWVLSDAQQQLIPGNYYATEAYKCGRALPKGILKGARPYITKEELQKLLKFYWTDVANICPHGHLLSRCVLVEALGFTAFGVRVLFSID